MTKLCTKCKHIDILGIFCTNPEVIGKCVTGQMPIIYVKEARGLYGGARGRVNVTICGVEAKYYEPKWWVRIVNFIRRQE